MKLISHRGNLTGPNSCVENHPDSVFIALNSGYDCEIDVWKIDENFFLGHDLPEYEISKSFLIENLGLWIHCKNFEALEDLFDTNVPNNIFFHDKDDYTITSKGVIWAFPGKKVGKNCVRVQKNIERYPQDIYGICSDFVADYKTLLDKK